MRALPSQLTALALLAALRAARALDGEALRAGGAPDGERLCAVGDLHGDVTHAHAALRLCGVVPDGEWRWVGGRTTVVQTGDVVDRGAESIPLLRKLWALRDDAAAAGGELVLLIGNHELLNMQGATMYVDKGEMHAFGGRAAWQQAMSPAHGEIGARLLEQPGAAVRGRGGCRTLFIHAGMRLSTAASYESLDGFNGALRDQISRNSGPLLDARQGPLWWRGYARPHVAGLEEPAACEEVAEALATIGVGAKMMGVGHNIVPFVSSRCGGMLQMIDVGMSSAYDGRPAAWRCELDGAGQPAVRALYTGGEEVPPELCDACDELRGGGAERGGATVRGGDPHGDCSNYCTPGPRRPRTRAPSSGIAKLASQLFGVDGAQPDSASNHAKVEF